MSYVLLVEDEPDLRTVISYNLLQAGHEALAVGSGLEAQRAIEKRVPDLVILDLMLPDLPGTEICRELRRNERTSTVPVLMLTAKGEESNRVYGLEIGADDYLVKPASMRELVLRVDALLRRSAIAVPPTPTRTQGVAATADGDGRLEAAGLTLNVSERTAGYSDEVIQLTALETRLLQVLVARAGRVQSRETLLAEVWDGEDVSSRTVDMRIARLRTRLGAAGALIESVRGLGYRCKGSGD